MGRIRIGVQRARRGVDLSVFEFRRARARPQARAGEQFGYRALRNRPREHGRRRRRGEEFRAPGGHRRAWTPRFLRGGGFHARSGPGRRRLRYRSRLHGPSPGHDDHGDRRHPVGRGDARALPRRADDSGDRIAAAGARAPRRYDPATHGVRPRLGGQELGLRGARRLAKRQSVERHAGHPIAVQRALFGDADRRRVGLQYVAQPSGDALARGRHLRRLGFVYPSARRDQWRGMVGDLSADRRRAGRL